MTRPKTEYLRDGDVHIAWQAIGSGPIDLLVTPGFISHLDLNWTHPAFADFIDHLTGFARVILFDKRGTGLSDHDSDADRFERRMQDIELVLDAAGSERCTILGLSEGGPLACLFAVTRPERVQSLVLCGTFARGSLIEPEVVERFEYAVDHWGEGFTAGIFLSGSDGPIARRFVSLFERAAAGPGMARRLLASIVACDVTSVLPNLSTPTLVIHRSHDPFAKLQWSVELEELIPNASRIELDGDDHLPWMGGRNDVARAIEEWVTGSVAAPDLGRSRFAAVLFTDIVGSTSRAALAGDQSWAVTLQAHNDVCREMFDRHDGWAVKSTGDGFVACFNTPDEAATCAFELHRALRRHEIEIRAGLHCGEIERIDLDDVAGIAVNIAARLCAMAGSATTLATRVLTDQLVGSAIAIHGVGRHRLKGVPGLVEVAEIQAAETVIDLRSDDRVTGGITLGLAKRNPAFVRRLARLTGAR